MHLGRWTTTGAALALCAAVAGCAHGGVLPGAGERCESFSDFDARVREQLEQALSSAAGDELVARTSRLNAERRACARQVLRGLPGLRETAGVERLQHELDALAVTYRPEDLDALLDDALGPDARALQPFVTEARSRAERSAREAARARADEAARRAVNDGPAIAAEEARTRAVEAERAQRDDAAFARLRPDSQHDDAALARQRDAAEAKGGSELLGLERASSEPPEPLGGCDEASACARLACVAARPEARLQPQANLEARACLDEVRELPALPRARKVASALRQLKAFGPAPALTEAATTLETLRRQLWPEVEAATKAGRPGKAAQLASPFLALESSRAEVQRLRDAALARHLARAKALEATPTAAWLLRRLAAEVGGPEVSAVPPEPGRWSPLRWSCGQEPAPALPPVPFGLEAVPTLRCRDPEPTKARSPEQQTFDLGLQGQRLKGTLLVACADRSSSYSLTVEEPGVEGVPTQAVHAELQRLLARAVPDCARIHEYAALRSCTELSRRPAAELIRRNVLHAAFTGRWPQCFVEWLEFTEGVGPPEVPSMGGRSDTAGLP